MFKIITQVRFPIVRRKKIHILSKSIEICECIITLALSMATGVSKQTHYLINSRP